MPKKEDRLLNPQGRRHYRRTWSTRETRWGLLVLAGLLSVAGWVAWKGAHPDPSLFELDPALLSGAPADVPRGPMPENLAPDGWTEGAHKVYGTDNVYEKINGREGFYKSFGFVSLHAIALTDDAEPSRAVDLELYDLGSAENAAGCFAGELPEGAEPTVKDGGLWVQHRNALLLTRGHYYLRAIGSEESEAIDRVLGQVSARYLEGLEGGALPWAFGLFINLGVPPSKVTYTPEDAFSFAFAKEVYSARPSEAATELFVVAAKDPAAAVELAGRFVEGFGQMGEGLDEDEAGIWMKDRYLGELSGATAEGRFVVGVRSAPDLDAAQAALEDLRQAIGDVSAPAVPEAGAGNAGDEDPAYDDPGEAAVTDPYAEEYDE